MKELNAFGGKEFAKRCEVFHSRPPAVPPMEKYVLCVLSVSGEQAFQEISKSTKLIPIII